jgi:phosphatidylinositol alpha-1,6-mannosyltransferase
MKMLFITDRFPPCEGGSRIYYYNLCRNYRAGEVIVLTTKTEGYKEFDKFQKFRIIRRGSPLPDWKIQRLPRALLPLLSTIYLTLKEKIDVIHCGDFFPGGAIGLFMKKLFGKPYVYYVHGEGNSWFNKFRFQPKFRKIILKNADRIVAACSFAEQGVKRDLNGGYEKVLKITPGVDHQKFKTDWKDKDLIRELGVENKKIILTIGRLVDRKGQDTVIRAMPRILTEVPEVVYLVCGRGPYEETLKHLAKECNVENHVKFLGFVQNERLPNFYSICDLFVMINRETPGEGPEGYGMVFSEANAAGKAVIGGRSGGTEDSILEGITGYRVDPLNSDEVASNIIRLLKDEPLRITLGRNCREWVVKNCNWRERARQLEDLNTSICEDRKN